MWKEARGGKADYTTLHLVRNTEAAQTTRRRPPHRPLVTKSEIAAPHQALLLSSSLERSNSMVTAPILAYLDHLSESARFLPRLAAIDLLLPPARFSRSLSAMPLGLVMLLVGRLVISVSSSSSSSCSPLEGCCCPAEEGRSESSSGWGELGADSSESSESEPRGEGVARAEVGFELIVCSCLCARGERWGAALAGE